MPMPRLRRALVVVLLLAIAPPLAMWPLAVFAPSTLLGMFKMSSTGDVRTVALYFGLAAGAVGACGVLAMVWIIKRREGGLHLATLIGGMMALGGVVMLAIGPEPSFAILDLVKGGAVALLARIILARESRVSTD
jgi:hypothetical protein